MNYKLGKNSKISLNVLMQFKNQFVDDICVDDIIKGLIHGKFQN